MGFQIKSKPDGTFNKYKVRWLSRGTLKSQVLIMKNVLPSG